MRRHLIRQPPCRLWQVCGGDNEGGGGGGDNEGGGGGGGDFGGGDGVDK